MRAVQEWLECASIGVRLYNGPLSRSVNRRRRRQKLSLGAVAKKAGYSRQYLYELLEKHQIEPERVRRWQPGETFT